MPTSPFTAKPGNPIDLDPGADQVMGEPSRKSSFKNVAEGPAKVARTDGGVPASRAAGSEGRAAETVLNGDGGSASVGSAVGVGPLLPSGGLPEIPGLPEVQPGSAGAGRLGAGAGPPPPGKEKKKRTRL